MQTFDGVASLETVRAHVERWMQEVKERRKQNGKNVNVLPTKLLKEISD